MEFIVFSLLGFKNMNKQKAINLLKKIKQHKPKILVLGDVMLDHYIYGDVERISPEAPVPIINYKKERDVLGGAGNVVANLSNLNCEVYLATIFGDDSDGNVLKEMLLRLNIILETKKVSKMIQK